MSTGTLLIRCELLDIREVLEQVWTERRTNGSVACLSGGAIALIVAPHPEEDVSCYRLRCTRCGFASHWFAPTVEGPAIRLVPNVPPCG